MEGHRHFEFLRSETIEGIDGFHNFIVTRRLLLLYPAPLTKSSIENYRQIEEHVELVVNEVNGFKAGNSTGYLFLKFRCVYLKKSLKLEINLTDTDVKLMEEIAL